MKKICFATILALISVESLSQSRKMDIVLGFGTYSTPSRKPIITNGNFNAEFEFYLNKKISLSAGLVHAEYWYEDPKSNASINGINISSGSEFQSNFLVKYNLINDEIVDLKIGTGVGAIAIARLEEIITDRSSYPLNVSNTTFGFPIIAEIVVPVYKNLRFGIKGGTFWLPDFLFVGNNIGFQLRYRL